MPQPIKITLQNKVYTTPVLTGEMENLAQQIQQKKDEIRSLNEHLTTAIRDLNSYNQQFMAMYIQQTGSFPEN
jgi:hypothetical protein